jgi:hypothetical protein
VITAFHDKVIFENNTVGNTFFDRSSSYGVIMNNDFNSGSGVYVYTSPASIAGNNFNGSNNPVRNTGGAATAGTIVRDNVNMDNEASIPSDWEFRSNDGFPTENAGSETQSGDGSTTTFNIPHGLAEPPTQANVIAGSADAAGEFWVSAFGQSTIEITYASAPAGGTDNLSWYWEAEV